MKLNMARREALTAYLFIAPLVLGFVLWNIGPLIASFGLSLTEFNLLEPPKFVLFQNYGALFTDNIFPIAFRNTLIYALVTVPMGLIISLALALAMNQGIKGTVLFRTIFFMPSVCAIAAIALVWQWIYDSDLGILNHFLMQFGLPKFRWLQDRSLALSAIMAMSIWQGAGYTMVIYLAGLQGIPTQLYEAAEIDGAGAWSRLRHVTLPMLTPTTFFLLVVGFIGAFQFFAESYMMTRGGPSYATMSLVYMIYLNGFSYFKMGFASAIAWVLFAVVFLLTLLQLRYARRWVHYE
jgi:multiple sugar transport system permease protein